MKLKVFLCLMFVTAALLVSCDKKGMIDAVQVGGTTEDERETSSASVIEDSYYKLYFQDKYKMGKHEPLYGAYLGAYVLDSKPVNFDFESFDKLIDKSLSSYAFSLKLGDDLPVTWLLRCISAYKTPQLIVYPPNNFEPYSERYLQDFAKKLGEFYVPMFVQFYPNPENYAGTEADYKNFFAKAASALKEHASNVSIVWSIDSKSLLDSENFFPGDENLDWVGLNLYLPIFENDVKSERDIVQEIENFCLQYQKSKPLMLSQLAISHFSSVDHSYNLSRCERLLQEVFAKIAKDYNRIKFVNYMDINNIDISPSSAKADDYSISSEDVLIEAFKQAVGLDFYLENVQSLHADELVFENFLSISDILEREGQFFIEKSSIENDLGEKIQNFLDMNKLHSIHGEYYPLNLFLDNYGYSFHFDRESGQGFLSKAGARP